MTIDYPTLTNTIKVLSELEKNILVDKLLDNLSHNEIQKSEKHNKKEDSTTSYFAIDLEENEIDEIIDCLQELQMREGDVNEEKFYYYSDLIDNWVI